MRLQDVTTRYEQAQAARARGEQPARRRNPRPLVLAFLLTVLVVSLLVLIARAEEGPSKPTPNSTPTTYAMAPVIVDLIEAQPVSHRRQARRRSASPAMLACIRRWESGTSGGYRAVSPSGRFRGAYQFDQRTWNSVAPRGYRRVRPDQAPPAVQDEAARRLYAQRGLQPWPGRAKRNCARHA